MKTAGKIVGLAAAMFAATPVALAHELACEKTVNGGASVEAATYPFDAEYSLTVTNIHPDSPSEVLEASDAILEGLGFEGFDTPVTLKLGGSTTKTFTVTIDNYEECLALAALDGEADAFIDNTFTVRWDSGSAICGARVHCVAPNQPPPEEEINGRMTGGGSVFTTAGKRVTHGFQLRCDADDHRQNLQVNFLKHRFHLTDLLTAECTDNPALDEGQPVAGFDTFHGTGTGRYDGEDGATIEFTFTDDGEPGVNDTAHIVIRDASGAVVLEVNNKLTFGNHQAHPASP